ncbi:MAG: diaminopimelate decarboxylase [Candidatus Zixiibacteriota bacterium]
MPEGHFFASKRFSMNGVNIDRVLEKYATPFYLYSAELIRKKYRQLERWFPGFSVFYSLKANPNLAICKVLLSLGARAEVSSLGELKTALEAGFKPGNIIFVGPGKTKGEIEYAVRRGIRALAVESGHELRLIESIAEDLDKSVSVLLRINTCKRPKVAPEIMVGGPSKFGFDEESVVDQVLGIELRRVKLIGIHVYSASQVLDSNFICEQLENILQVSLRLSKEIGFQVRCVDFGGGFGIPYQQKERELDFEKISEKAKYLLKKYGESLADCVYILEVGRYLVAEAGVFVTKVVRIKQSRGENFVITDAGMNHLTRPAFMRMNHPIRILNKVASENWAKFNVCGPCCTPLDVLGTAVELPMPEEGDIIGILNAGAYGYTMSMPNFLSFGSPKEIMIDKEKIHQIRRTLRPEESFEDQLVVDGEYQ